jgi:hypothetical protein
MSRASTGSTPICSPILQDCDQRQSTVDEPRKKTSCCAKKLLLFGAPSDVQTLPTRTCMEQSPICSLNSRSHHPLPILMSYRRCNNSSTRLKLRRNRVLDSGLHHLLRQCKELSLAAIGHMSVRSIHVRSECDADIDFARPFRPGTTPSLIAQNSYVLTEISEIYHQCTISSTAVSKLTAIVTCLLPSDTLYPGQLFNLPDHRSHTRQRHGSHLGCTTTVTRTSHNLLSHNLHSAFGH